ncbi:hypothetical protein K9N68_05580 [Kovacikia minuta CCNUW1]|uniref:hypothetical protein n=1 Tax=Kovacikia minuta TaxID=2931930 RepID=UPI001CCE5049|nr:hypothetical protein [Kovacikia minuta]UBF27419.1 hypothetical protein K9N68_05580 [Kovacikia minuta CCNUW1]
MQVRVNAAGQPIATPPGLLLSNFRQSLDLAIPYWSDPSQSWEPGLQWSEQLSLPLAWCQQAIIALLKTLVAGSDCSAEGMNANEFHLALAQVVGVVLGCPTGWSDTYRFNLREAVLAAGLVAQPEQIFFIPDAIAALLSQFPVPPEKLDLKRPTRPKETLFQQGGTLVLNAGATVTELLLTHAPQDGQPLTRTHLSLRSIAYGGNAIDQDIICQLFYPSVWGWRNLGETSLDLPLPGEPDLQTRYRFQQRLQSHNLGRILLAIARQIKTALQQQDSASFGLNDQQWTMHRQDLHNRVLVPYIQLLNRELNGLLAETETGIQAVQQVIRVGGTVAFPAIDRWLQQKFPHATLLQQNSSPHPSSQIAHGLAKLPLYPQFLDAAHHQYSDYFLLRELLRLFPTQPLSLEHVLQLLENQGIDVQSCQQAILDLLEGQLPIGLVPSSINHILLTPASKQNPDYQTATAVPVFSRQSHQVYSLNMKQRDFLWQYLTTLLKTAHQNLEKPLPVNLQIAAPM